MYHIESVTVSSFCVLLAFEQCKRIKNCYKPVNEIYQNCGFVHSYQLHVPHVFGIFKLSRFPLFAFCWLLNNVKE